jgi:hypothetical protein
MRDRRINPRMISVRNSKPLHGPVQPIVQRVQRRVIHARGKDRHFYGLIRVSPPSSSFSFSELAVRFACKIV